MTRTNTTLIVACLSLAISDAAIAEQLEGSSWQLVEIQSMDDTVKMPSNPSDYTLDFLAEGTVAIKADCNRGTGSWASEAEGEISFGLIASTKALCPPESLSEDFLGQFQWVRSYTFEDGNLYLATMADGSILKFEPSGSDATTAQVLGTNLIATDESELVSAILTPLLDQYASETGIEVEPSEIDGFLEDLRDGKEQEGLTSDEDLTEEEAAQIEEMETSMATSMIRQWKINKALHEGYGGRIIYQQLGPEPLDAYRAFLESRQADGAFEIFEPALADGFWSYFTDEARHDFMEPGSADAQNAFSTPVWE